MIRTLMLVDWINLKRDRVALALTFILPIVFFSIFAMIFGGMSGGTSGGGPGSIRVIVVDQDDSEVSRRYVKAIGDQDALSVYTAPNPTEDDPDPAPYTRDTAKHSVRTGQRPIAVIIPNGFGENFASFSGDQKNIELIYDAANPIALNTVGGLLQAAAMIAAPDILMESGLEQLELAGGFLTDEQKEIIEKIKPALRGETSWDSLDDDEPVSNDMDDQADVQTDAADTEAEAAESSGVAFQGLISVTTTEAREGDTAEDESPPFSIITYYAAAIGVMFLLFSMAGASSSILEDVERGTLERLISTRIGMGSLLFSHWLFFSIIGVFQLVFMFLFGELAYGIQLFTIKHIVGFLIMTVFTSGAAAAFGLVLATICRSRAQLGGISTIVILIMSALGGSMVPRMVVPILETTSKFTFNGWALDGFQKVFWNADPNHTLVQSIVNLGPQLALLAGVTILLLALSRHFARRWETV